MLIVAAWLPWHARSAPQKSYRVPDAPPIPANCGPRALLVGPEGGFVKTELESLRLRTFVNSVSLGPRILRADTACIAGLALLQGMDGR